MNRRARLPLRLQQTVEGLSVAAIVHCGVGLVADLAQGFKAGGVAVDANMTAALALPVVALLALWVVRRTRKHVREADGAPAPSSN